MLFRSANEVKNEYSDDEFSEMYPDYENFNWYDEMCIRDRDKGGVFMFEARIAELNRFNEQNPVSYDKRTCLLYTSPD